MSTLTDLAAEAVERSGQNFPKLIEEKLLPPELLDRAPKHPIFTIRGQCCNSDVMVNYNGQFTIIMKKHVNVATAVDPEETIWRSTFALTTTTMKCSSKDKVITFIKNWIDGERTGLYGWRKDHESWRFCSRGRRPPSAGLRPTPRFRPSPCLTSTST